MNGQTVTVSNIEFKVGGQHVIAGKTHVTRKPRRGDGVFVCLSSAIVAQSRHLSTTRRENTMIRRLANLNNPDSMASQMRRKRFELFTSMLPPSPRILDLGGTVGYWQRQPAIPGAHVTLLNIDAQHGRSEPGFNAIIGDACDLSRFSDGVFDVVHSNSLIEHVGDWSRQQQLADEVRRVGRAYWIQTPNRYFPIEPHFHLPLFQFWPLSLRLWWYRKSAYAQAEMRQIRLLSANEMRRLFPDGTLWREQLFGLTKSLVAFRR